MKASAENKVTVNEKSIANPPIFSKYHESNQVKYYNKSCYWHIINSNTFNRLNYVYGIKRKIDTISDKDSKNIDQEMTARPNSWSPTGAEKDDGQSYETAQENLMPKSNPDQTDFSSKKFDHNNQINVDLFDRSTSSLYFIPDFGQLTSENYNKFNHKFTLNQFLATYLTPENFTKISCLLILTLMSLHTLLNYVYHKLLVQGFFGMNSIFRKTCNFRRFSNLSFIIKPLLLKKRLYVSKDNIVAELIESTQIVQLKWDPVSKFELLTWLQSQWLNFLTSVLNVAPKINHHQQFFVYIFNSEIELKKLDTSCKLNPIENQVEFESTQKAPAHHSAIVQPQVVSGSNNSESSGGSSSSSSANSHNNKPVQSSLIRLPMKPDSSPVDSGISPGDSETSLSTPDSSADSKITHMIYPSNKIYYTLFLQKLQVPQLIKNFNNYKIKITNQLAKFNSCNQQIDNIQTLYSCEFNELSKLKNVDLWKKLNFETGILMKLEFIGFESVATVWKNKILSLQRVPEKLENSDPEIVTIDLESVLRETFLEVGKIFLKFKIN